MLVMHFLAATTIIFSCSRLLFYSGKKKTFNGKGLISLKKLVLCCFMSE